jgi:hypothetical protein
MWNNTDIPLAVFCTFRCYGTWLHGDERGSVDRNNNSYGSPRIPVNRNWQKHSEELLLHPPVTLDPASRRSVEKAIRELFDRFESERYTTDARRWTLAPRTFTLGRQRK